MPAMHADFDPHPQLAALLLPAVTGGDDGAHDLSHLQRVWKNARAIHACEGGDTELLLAATLLHDCVAVEKNSPLRAQASRLSAANASEILRGLGWDDARIGQVAHVIEAHSFTAAIAPRTLEARILQDADRLDAIGMLGVARCFYVAGRMGSQLYHPADPQAQARPLDDAHYALDHFPKKLLTLADNFQTTEGARLAGLRHASMLAFLDAFAQEI